MIKHDCISLHSCTPDSFSSELAKQSKSQKNVPIAARWLSAEGEIEKLCVSSIREGYGVIDSIERELQGFKGAMALLSSISYIITIDFSL